MQIFIENMRKVMQNKKKLEHDFNIKIRREGDIINIDSKPEDELLAIEAFEAINLGFSIPQVLTMKDEGITFKKIPIKNFTKKNDTARIKGRIIGKEGKVLNVLENLTDCMFAVHNNFVGIIGREEEMHVAEDAVKRIIQGSKHSAVYAILEKHLADKKLQI